MIKLCDDSYSFLPICDKLNCEKLKGIKLTQKVLYDYMVAGLFNKHIFTFVSYENTTLNGCLVLVHSKDLFKEDVLSLLFTWIDPHYPELHREFLRITEEKARELNIKRICFLTNRNEKLINRKMGKYGFKKAFSVYEKEVV